MSRPDSYDDAAIIAKLGPWGWPLKISPDTGGRTAAMQISSGGSDSIQRYSPHVLALDTWYHGPRTSPIRSRAALTRDPSRRGHRH